MLEREQWCKLKKMLTPHQMIHDRLRAEFVRVRRIQSFMIFNKDLNFTFVTPRVATSIITLIKSLNQELDQVTNQLLSKQKLNLNKFKLNLEVNQRLFFMNLKFIGDKFICPLGELRSSLVKFHQFLNFPSLSNSNFK
jgi:hypothetical protein